MGWNSHNHNIVYMFTIYTLLLIELRIIGSRIWTAYSFIFGIRFNRRQRQREREIFIHLVIYCEEYSLVSLRFGLWMILCNVYGERCADNGNEEWKKRRKYETIDKCWFAALISRSAWVWHGFVRPFALPLSLFYHIIYTCTFSGHFK